MLALPKRQKRAGVSFSLSEDGSRPSYRNILFSNIKILDDAENPKPQ
jgi:hypothetical protein